MSDTVTNLVGHADPHGSAAAGAYNARAPLSDLFAELLSNTNFADHMPAESQFALTRAADRDVDLREAADDAAQARADAHDASTEVDAADEPAGDDGDGQSDEPAAGGDGADSEPAAASEDGLSNMTTPPPDGPIPGLTVQPNAASGVELKAKTDGATPGQSRVAGNRGGAQAAAHQQSNAGDAAAQRGNEALGKVRAGAETQPSDAAMKKSGLNGDAAAAKPAAGGAATEKASSTAASAQLQAQAAAGANGDEFAASVEQHTSLVRTGARRAAELHQMKLRLDAHRSAIKKAIAQSTATAGNQQQGAASGAGKPVIEVTASATPPAAAALDGPAARPATLFNATAPGTLPGQSALNGAQRMAAGDSIGNGAEQAANVADRQSLVASAARNVAARPTPAQPAFQPAEQVKVHIQQLVKSGNDRIQIKLSPASLGRVEVTLELSPDKTVHAVVYADKPETLDMLERDARVLQRAFEDAGLQFDSNSLTFQQGRPGNPEAQLSHGAAPTDSGAAAEGDAAGAGDIADADSQRRRQHDGMLDLEI